MTFVRERYATARPLVVRRGLFPASPPMDPSDVTGLVTWLDASQIGGLSDTDPVSSWTNEAPGVTESFTQATGASQPVYRTNQLNGRPGVVFDGTNDHLDGSISRTLKPATFFVVASSTAVTSNNFLIGNVSGSRALILTANNSKWEADAEGAVLIGVSTTALSNGVNYQADFSYAASGGFQFGLNGANDGAGTMDTAIDPVAVCIGARDSSSLFYAGTIYEVLIYDNVVASTDRDDLRDYLITKWSL